MGEQTLRFEVSAMAGAMEQKLRENDHKGGWKDESFAYLTRRLREEVDELIDAVKRRKEGWPPGKFIREAADVANFAMMIADVAGDLRPAPAPPPLQEAPTCGSCGETMTGRQGEYCRQYHQSAGAPPATERAPKP